MNTKFSFKKLILIMLLILSICSCSSLNKINNTRTIETENLDLIEYGMSVQEITSQLGYSGKLLFVFISEGKEYNITLFKATKNSTPYLFLHEENTLISIITEQDGMAILNQNYGEHGNNIPSSKYFNKIIKGFENKKLRLEYSFK